MLWICEKEKRENKLTPNGGKSYDLSYIDRNSSLLD